MMYVGQMLHYYSDMKPRKPRRDFEEPIKKCPQAGKDNVKKAMAGQPGMTSQQLAKKMGIKPEYAKRLMGKYKTLQYVRKDGEIIGENGGRPQTIYVWCEDANITVDS